MTHRVTVSSFQLAENDHGEEGHPAKDKESPVDALNKLRGIRTIVIRNEEDSHRRRRSDTKTDGHLLRGASDGTGAALLLLVDIRLHQRVHARILQRQCLGYRQERLRFESLKAGLDTPVFEPHEAPQQEPNELYWANHLDRGGEAGLHIRREIARERVPQAKLRRD